MWVPKEVTGKGKERHKWILLREDCDQKDFSRCAYQSDKYGNCCVIRDRYNRPMMFTRYPDFPWGEEDPKPIVRDSKFEQSQRGSGSDQWIRALIFVSGELG